MSASAAIVPAVLAYSPEMLPPSAVESIYSTDLTGGAWSPTVPEPNASAVFMKLQVK